MCSPYGIIWTKEDSKTLDKIAKLEAKIDELLSR